MADQDGRQLWRHVTSSPHDADFKGYIFRRTIYPPSLVVQFLYPRSYGGRGGGEFVESGLNGVNTIFQKDAKDNVDVAYNGRSFW